MESNAFSRLLSEHREGACISELSAALSEVVDAVRKTGKPGSVVLEVKICPASKGAANAVTVVDTVKTKTATPERAASFFFADDANRLTRDNPNQMKLDLKTVPAAPVPTELKAVSAS